MSAPPPTTAPGAMDSHTEIAAGLGQHIAGEIRRRLPEWASRMREGGNSGASAGFAVYVNLGWEAHGQCMVAHVNIVGDPQDLRLPIRLDATGDLQLIPQAEAMAIESANAMSPLAAAAPPQPPPQPYAQPQPVPWQPQPQMAPPQGTGGPPVMPPPQPPALVTAPLQPVQAVPEPPPHVLPGQSEVPGAVVQMSNGGTQRNPGKIMRRQLSGD